MRVWLVWELDWEEQTVRSVHASKASAEIARKLAESQWVPAYPDETPNGFTVESMELQP